MRVGREIVVGVRGGGVGVKEGGEGVGEIGHSSIFTNSHSPVERGCWKTESLAFISSEGYGRDIHISQQL